MKTFRKFRKKYKMHNFVYFPNKSISFDQCECTRAATNHVANAMLFNGLISVPGSMYTYVKTSNTYIIPRYVLQFYRKFIF